jgi:hypothetical protein
MDLPVTAALSLTALALTVLFGWLGARPAKPLSEPRLAPWRVLMVAAFLGTVMLLVHLVQLLKAR